MRIPAGIWKDWEAYILGEDGQRLLEHDIVHVPEENNTTFFVECKPGQSFRIGVGGNTGVKRSCVCKGRMDGLKLPLLQFHPSVSPVPWHNYISSWWHRVDGKYLLKTLRFAKINLTEDGPIPPKETLSGLGTIVLTLTSGKLTALHTPMRTSFDPGDPVSQINKKTKKAVGVGFGDTLREGVPVSTHSFEADKTPQYTITIMYRTREAIIAQDIIEAPARSASSEPTPTPADIKPKLKRRPSGSPSPLKKRRTKPKKAQDAAHNNSAVIDLTGDESDDDIVELGAAKQEKDIVDMTV